MHLSGNLNGGQDTTDADQSRTAIMGANDTMGCHVAAILALFDHAKVRMVSRNMQKNEAIRIRTTNSVHADSNAANMIPADENIYPRTCMMLS